MHWDIRICSHEKGDPPLRSRLPPPSSLPVPCTLFVPEGRQVSSSTSTHPAAPPWHVTLTELPPAAPPWRTGCGGRPSGTRTTRIKFASGTQIRISFGPGLYRPNKRRWSYGTIRITRTHCGDRYARPCRPETPVPALPGRSGVCRPGRMGRLSGPLPPAVPPGIRRKYGVQGRAPSGQPRRRDDGRCLSPHAPCRRKRGDDH